MGNAIIDIGSNTIRYLGASGKRVITTRLAEGLLSSGALSLGAMNRSMDALREFSMLAAKEGRVPCCYATSAVRDASNGAEFCGRVERELNMKIDILSGEREARYAYLGATHGRGALIDIGGGSAQIVDEYAAVSFPMGCVRAKELMPGDAASFEQAYNSLVPRFGEVFKSSMPAHFDNCTGVGGTITTLAALQNELREYDPNAVQGTIMTRECISRLASALWEMEGSRKFVPLLRDRHDVIIPGAIILLYLMDRLCTKSVRVSDADGMEGYREHCAGR